MWVAADQAGAALSVFGSADEVTDWLSENAVNAVLVDTSVNGAERLCFETRSEAKLAQVPILAVVREVGDLAFAEVFSWGGDDVVELGATRPLITRLRVLCGARFGPPERNDRRALVAEGERHARIVLGRVLRNAGYTVTFAVSAEDALRLSAADAPDLVVASAQLGPPRDLVYQARCADCSATFIVRASPRDVRRYRTELAGLAGAVVTDGFAPPENVLFLANELVGRRGADHRSSQRLLYGATVAFRAAGRDRDEYGYTYNVSAGGLYVRTLAPPEDDTVWLEVVPPRSDRRVRLEGRVAWRRRFGPTGHATVPPGFGVELTDGSSADRMAWREGYRHFAEALG